MSGKSAETQIEDIANALGLIESSGTDQLNTLLYTPDTRIAAVLAKLKPLADADERSQAERRQAGRLMEQLAYLALSSLRGCDVVKSYNSMGPQIDLLVNGSTVVWLTLCTVLRIDKERRGILLEAKARSTKVDDADFARMCSLVEGARATTSLGVFFCLKGATGFGKESGRSLHSARLRQVLHYARTRSPIVVLDWAELQTLTEPGALVRILEQKVRAIDELSYASIMPAVSVEVQLPEHLAELAPPG